MPDSVTHFYFGRQVLSVLPTEIVNKIDIPIFEQALQGPDPWSTIGFFGGRVKKYSSYSNVMHNQKTGEFLYTLTKDAKNKQSVSVFSFLIGFLCHYSLDKTAHPFIICKGGEYDGTENTKQMRGGHVRLERAIDSFYIRKEYGKIPWHFSMPKNIFKLKRFPEDLRNTLEMAFEQVYGLKDGFDLFNRALRDERRFYGLMQDPFGFVHYLLRPISFGKTNFSLFSYYHRDIDNKKIDYMNEQHAVWHHPNDSKIASNEDFFELFDRAKSDAYEMIVKAYGIIFGGKELQELPYGNSSYSSGFDCDDLRNDSPLTFEPFVYNNKYRN